MKDSAELAAFFGISTGTLRVRRHRGQCPPPSKKIGRKCFWEEQTIAEWILKQEEREKR